MGHGHLVNCFLHGHQQQPFCLVFFHFLIIILLPLIIFIITFTALTFRGGCLGVTVAIASGEMDKDPLSLLGFAHQWKGL